MSRTWRTGAVSPAQQSFEAAGVTLERFIDPGDRVSAVLVEDSDGKFVRTEVEQGQRLVSSIEDLHLDVASRGWAAVR